jgi:CheY-like chemotaxis protein
MMFEMYYYDDGQHRCYINPNLRSRTDGRLQPRLGVAPEELSWAGLSPRQRSYYERWSPAVAHRFRRDTSATGQEAASGGCKENTSSQLRVLIVTDDSEAGRFVAECVRLLGHIAIAVSDRASAISVGAAWRPDVALLDIQLEDGDTGYELAKLLRNRLGSSVCLVAHTGYMFAEIWSQLRDADFDEFLQKPADLNELRRLLGRTGRGHNNDSAE